MKPPWIKAHIPAGKNYRRLKSLLQTLKLHTVCEEARCPNIGHCWDRQTATVMIMGDICTRSCGFCAVKTGRPSSLDVHEPQHVAEAVQRLGLKHVVITSVDRDDLPDGGAAHFAETIRRVKQLCPQTRVEVLIPDFRAKDGGLEAVLEARPHVLNHNLETVKSLQAAVRPQASYERSLEVLQQASRYPLVTKSGLMLGLGEQADELRSALRDLRQIGGVTILTLGQYLSPSPNHLPVRRYYTPEEFDLWAAHARALGFAFVASGPLVRSSYHAEEAAEGLVV